MSRERRRPSKRYQPARRLNELRLLLESSEGITLAEIASTFRTSVKTATRYLSALEESGEEIEVERQGKTKRWRIAPTGREESVRMSSAQMMSLYLGRQMFDFLAGTGFKEDLDTLFENLAKTLRRKDYLAARYLDRKLYYVAEAPFLYAEQLDFVDAILTALLREERLRVAHRGLKRAHKPFLFEPYTLVAHKEGLYLLGYSHHHMGVRTLALDGFTKVEHVKREKFTFPADYHPRSFFEGAFGLVSGEPTDVRVVFTEEVARYVRRRLWHPTQKITAVARGHELRMRVAHTAELVNWIVGWGNQAEVLAPESLRAEVAEIAAGMVARYADR